jgi:lysophospholipase L1-like esterase
LPGDTLTFLALGDSYTIGEAIPTEESWPWQLVHLLRRQGATIADPTILATTGWTSGQLLSRLDRVTFLRAEYDLVSLLIGVNNQYRGGDPERFRRELVTLLNRAVALAGNDPQRVLVLSIPDYSITPFAATRDPAAIAANLVQFNEIVRHEAGTAGTRYINITPLSLQAAGRPDLLATDGLHPSGAMYALWADAVLPAACAALSVAP